MREIHKIQLGLLPNPVDHPHARELEAINQFLVETPIIAALATQDLLGDNASPRWGSPGMSGDQVIRCLIVKQMNGYSYEELAFHLADSLTYRRFCRIGIADKPPSRSTLQSNISRISESTLESINQWLVHIAKDEGIEEGNSVRVDATPVATDIHHPSDSSLLWDTVRVLVRLMRSCQELDPGVCFTDHSLRAKRRSLGVSNARNKRTRRRAYQDLFKVSERTLGSAERIASHMEEIASSLPWVKGEIAIALAKAIRHFSGLGRRVVDQARRRILLGERVPPEEKVVSIFEEHSDIIQKDKRETRFGHKIFLSSGVSSMVLDCAMPRGNPADSQHAEEMVQRASDILESMPRDVSMDGGFASKRNLAAIKAMGVENVCFSKRRGLAVSDMVSSTWIYKRLRNFRAGIEGVISFLKRCFGLDRCVDKGWPGFKRYVWRSIISLNLLLMARHRLKSA